MYNGEETHWCYQCNQSFGIRGREVICPHCHGGFVQELREVHGLAAEEDGLMTNPRDFPHQVPWVFDAMHALMGENGLTGRDRFMQFVNLLMREEMIGIYPNFDVRGWSGFIPEHRREHWEEDLSPDPYMVFHGPSSDMALRRSGVGRGPRHIDMEEYFTGMGLQELIEQLSVNVHRRPNPASQSAINSMPTIRITQEHIQSDSVCPVCKENFVLDSEVKMMPCHHIYHSDCITPWLVQQNSCPVCRYEMPTQGTRFETGTSLGVQASNGFSRSTSHGGGGGESAGQSQGGRVWFPSWPLHSGISNRHRRSAESGGRVENPTVQEDHEMHYSGWPFDY